MPTKHSVFRPKESKAKQKVEQKKKWPDSIKEIHMHEPKNTQTGQFYLPKEHRGGVKLRDSSREPSDDSSRPSSRDTGHHASRGGSIPPAFKKVWPGDKDDEQRRRIRDDLNNKDYYDEDERRRGSTESERERHRAHEVAGTKIRDSRRVYYEGRLPSCQTSRYPYGEKLRDFVPINPDSRKNVERREDSRSHLEPPNRERDRRERGSTRPDDWDEVREPYREAKERRYKDSLPSGRYDETYNGPPDKNRRSVNDYARPGRIREPAHRADLHGLLNEDDLRRGTFDKHEKYAKKKPYGKLPRHPRDDLYP